LNSGPSASHHTLRPNRVIFTACLRIRNDLQPLRPMFRVRLRCVMVEPNLLFRAEETTAVPAISLWPESEGGQKRRPADRGPRVGVFRIRNRLRRDFANEINQEAPAGRKVASAFVNASVKPLPFEECVGIRAPLDQFGPFGRAPTEHDCSWCFASEQNVDPSRDRVALFLRYPNQPLLFWQLDRSRSRRNLTRQSIHFVGSWAWISIFESMPYELRQGGSLSSAGSRAYSAEASVQNSYMDTAIVF
jgi:hypothetical protein